MDANAAKALRLAAMGASDTEVKNHTHCTVTADGDVINANTGKVLAKARSPVAEAKNSLPTPENSLASQAPPAKPQSIGDITPQSYMQIVQSAFSPAQPDISQGSTYAPISPEEYMQTVQTAFDGNNAGGDNDAMQTETSAGLENAMDDGYNESNTGFTDDEAYDSTEAPYSGLYRRAENTGVFAVLPERMSKKHIRKIAKEYGISIKGLSFVIDFEEEKLQEGFEVTGRADYFNIGRIDLFPKAFKSREELVRTLFHERQHVLQFKEFGTNYVLQNRNYFENLAYAAEEKFISLLKEAGQI